MNVQSSNHTMHHEEAGAFDWAKINCKTNAPVEISLQVTYCIGFRSAYHRTRRMDKRAVDRIN